MKSVRIRGQNFLGLKGDYVQFEINNEFYVMNFVPEEGRWYVLVPTENGVVRIPVEMDGPVYDTFGFAAGRDDEREVVN